MEFQEKRMTPHYPTHRRRIAWLARFQKKGARRELVNALKNVRRAFGEMGCTIYTLKSRHGTVHPLNFLARRHSYGNFGCVLCRIRYGKVAITPLEDPTFALFGNKKEHLLRIAGEHLRFDTTAYNPRRGRLWDWTELVLKKEIDHQSPNQ